MNLARTEQYSKSSSEQEVELKEVELIIGAGENVPTTSSVSNSRFSLSKSKGW